MSMAVVVTDLNVDALHGDGFVRELEDGGAYDRVERIVFAAGEQSKTLETYAELVRGFAALGMTRCDVVYALGGGVVGDLAGFAAATYMRGIDFIQVPTTLLAMVDSSIGGKTGVDIPEGKNLVGAFHLPKRIIRNCKYLHTLPVREVKNGLAEIIKTAILFDRELFDRLAAFASVEEFADFDSLADLVECCVGWKQRIVEQDFREGGLRKLLNLGHTFGHAIEAACGFRLGHGECVAVGMRIVGRDIPEIGAILDRYGYPQVNDVLKVVSAKQLGQYLSKDKKRAGDIVTLVVPRQIGRCELVETPLSELESWLR